MTDKKQALTDLLAKVEAGTLHKAPYGGMPILTKMYQHFAKSVEDWKDCGWSDAGAMAAYNGSLDAAKALDMALPTKAIMDAETMAIVLFSKDGARHWLAWKIKALIAEETQ